MYEVMLNVYYVISVTHKNSENKKVKTKINFFFVFVLFTFIFWAIRLLDFETSIDFIIQLYFVFILLKLFS